MRRTMLWPLALVLLALVGCGGSEEESGSASGGSGAPAAEQDAFPVTLEHKYGETTIESEPKRVAAIGLRESDDLLALDIVPVLVSEYFGIDQDGSGIRPWAKDKLGGAEEPDAISTTDGIPVEEVAASRPDVIIARFSGMTKDEYDQLSQIAPVVAQPKGYADYGEPWQEEMRAVGEVVGRSDDAEQLVTDTEDLLARTREEHPEFEGRTAVVATPYQGFYVYGPEDPRGRLLSDLGFDAPEGVEEIVGDQFGAALPDEQTDLLDVDALIWLVETQKQRTDDINGNPVYSRLGVKDRAIFTTPEDVVYNGSSATSVLSIPPVVEELVPQLQEAVEAAG